MWNTSFDWRIEEFFVSVQWVFGMPDHGSLKADQRQYAEYIGRMVQELSRMATAVDLSVLAFLLDMAAEEAILQSGKTPVTNKPSRSEEKRVPRRPSDRNSLG